MPDWGDALGKVVGSGYDKIRDGVDWGKEKVGEGVDWTTDKAGAGLDRLGHHKVADLVEDWGDRTASSLGAEVDEQQLGETEDANELIHGNPGKITAAVKNLQDFKTAFNNVGQGLKKLDSSHWKGEAAEAFREKFGVLPTDWLHASDAFEDAAKALKAYATTVRWAQGQAKEAIALHQEGKASYETAVEAHNKKVDAYNDARTGDHPLPEPDPFSDPGKAKRSRAQEILNEARRQRNEAADTAKTSVAAALAHAPKEPKGLDRAVLDLADYGVGTGIELAHVGSGFLKAGAGTVNFIRAIHPLDPYNITHPAEYYKQTNMTLAGLASTAAHPDRALKNAWEAFKKDPGEGVGRAIFEVVTPVKGAGAAKTISRWTKDLAERSRGKGRHGHDKAPDSTGEQCSKLKCEGDPVDIATGRMLLPQTDITLPGSLPLVFQRTFDSSYRAGRLVRPDLVEHGRPASGDRLRGCGVPLRRGEPAGVSASCARRPRRTHARPTLAP